MIASKLRDLLFGTISVTAKGKNLEKFINAVYHKGIILWDIRRISPTDVSFRMNPWAFFKLRPLVRQAGVKVKVLRKTGLPFFWYRLFRRKGILVGIALGAMILYVLSSFVWFVDVQGNKRLSKQQIVLAANKLGVKPGIWREQVDTTKLARDLKEQIPQAAWVGVTLNGTRIVIQIVEKVERPSPKPGKGNLVAAKTGLVTDVLVIKGVPRVREGQTVKKGQALIAAENIPAAQGFVRARVWYTGVGEAKLVDEGVTPTGNSSTSLRIKIGTKVIILTGKQSPFALYKEETTSKSLPKWRNIYIPVELITVRYQEMTHYKKVMSREEAVRAATEKALADLQRQLPPGVKVLDQRTELMKTKDPNLVKVHIDAETKEEIAVHEGA